MKNKDENKEKKAGPVKMGSDEKIKELEKLISGTKYNKRTQGAVGIYKAQLAKLRERKEIRSKSGPKFEGYAVRKTGDGTVVLVGFPSVGKSTLLNKLTNANSPIGAYEFTTLTVIPGLMEYKHAKIQVLDVPGIVSGAAAGTGRGKEVLAVMRNADLAIVLVDVFRPDALDALKREIYDFGLRINERKPNVIIKSKPKGGVDVAWTCPNTNLDKDIAERVLREMGIMNAYVVIHEDITVDQFLDAIEGNKIYLPAMVVLNKIDLVSEDELERLIDRLKPDLCISANDDVDFSRLKDLIFERLNLMRIYCKEVGKQADLDVPMIIHRHATVEQLCSKLHRDFVVKFKFCRVWGRSAKFPGQRFMLKHVLEEGDIVELHMK